MTRFDIGAATLPHATLADVVMAHCKDLEGCVPALREYGMNETADEFDVAIDELRAAVEAAHGPSQPKPFDEAKRDLLERGYFERAMGPKTFDYSLKQDAWGRDRYAADAVYDMFTGWRKARDMQRTNEPHPTSSRFNDPVYTAGFDEAMNMFKKFVARMAR